MVRRNPHVVEDVEWLLAAGETHPDAIFPRLGYATRRGLYLALRRAGRQDLISKLAEGVSWGSGL